MGIADFPTEIFKALRCLATDSAKTRLKLPMSSPPASTHESGLESKRSSMNESRPPTNEQRAPTNTTAFPSKAETIAENQATKQPASQNLNPIALRSRSGLMVQALRVKPLHLIAAGRDFLHVVNAGMKFPMTFTLSLAKGFHNAPILYGDESVRQSERITGIPSGLKAAGKVRTVLP
jgi:hypothetical protein